MNLALLITTTVLFGISVYLYLTIANMKSQLKQKEMDRQFWYVQYKQLEALNMDLTRENKTVHEVNRKLYYQIYGVTPEGKEPGTHG